jgi:hypothetical protein
LEIAPFLPEIRAPDRDADSITGDDAKDTQQRNYFFANGCASFTTAFAILEAALPEPPIQPT